MLTVLRARAKRTMPRSGFVSGLAGRRAGGPTPVEPLFDPNRLGTRVDKRSLWPLLLVVSVVALIAVLSFGAGILAERRLFGEPWRSSGRLVGVADDGD